MATPHRDCAEYSAILRGKGTGYTYGEVARLLQRAQFVVPGKPKGSHRVWVHQGTNRRTPPLVEKGHGEMLPRYVKQAARIMAEVGGCPE